MSVCRYACLYVQHLPSAPPHLLYQNHAPHSQDAELDKAWPESALEEEAAGAASVLPYAQHMRPVSSPTTTQSAQEGQGGA